MQKTILEQHKHHQAVKIPDLFESFRSIPPKINPLYAQVNEASLSWLAQICGFDKAAQIRLRKADFAYITAAAFPDLFDFAKLFNITNWFNWVFFFDDQLDDTAQREDKEPARRYIDSFSAVLEDDDDMPNSEREEEPSRYIFRCIWQAVKQDPCCSSEAKLRWAGSMKHYFAALRDALIFRPAQDLPDTIEGYVNYRLHTVGVFPIFAFVEYAYGLELPSNVWTNAEMIGLRETGVKMAMLDNDVVSHRREKDLGCPHNIIHLHLHHGLSEQEAYNEAHRRQRDLYRKWYTHRGSLPSYGEHRDREVQRYLTGVEQVVAANLNWSFRTQRYFGENATHVRQTRILPSHTQWLDGVIPERGLLLVTNSPGEVEAPVTAKEVDDLKLNGLASSACEPCDLGSKDESLRFERKDSAIDVDF